MLSNNCVGAQGILTKASNLVYIPAVNNLYLGLY